MRFVIVRIRWGVPNNPLISRREDWIIFHERYLYIHAGRDGLDFALILWNVSLAPLTSLYLFSAFL